MAKLNTDERADWARYWERATKGKGLDRLAAVVNVQLPQVPDSFEVRPSVREACENMDATKQRLHYLLGFPAKPLDDPERQAILYALARALDLDIADINRLGGAL